MRIPEEADGAAERREDRVPRGRKPGPSGYQRPKETRRSVLLADRLARRTITVGGIFVIVAVMGIMVFLVEETLPLFRGGRLQSEVRYDLTIPESRSLGFALDDYRTLGVDVAADGRVTVFHPPTGTALEGPSFDFGQARVTASARTPDGQNLAFGFSDGTLRFGSLRFVSEILPADGVPRDLAELGDGSLTDGAAVYTPIPGNQVRKVSLDLELEEPLAEFKAGSPVVALDYRMGGTAERPTRAFVTLSEGGQFILSLAESKRNLLTGEVRVRLRSAELPAPPREGELLRVLMNSKADTVYVVERDGRALRYNVKDLDEPYLAETVRLTPPGVAVTAVAFLIGESALAVGGSDGSVSIHFPVNRPDGPTLDGVQVVRARTLPPHRSAVSSLDTSLRGKTFVTADDSGEVWVRHATSEKTLLDLKGGDPHGEYRGLSLSPREDALVAVGADGQTHYWAFQIPHPETSWRTLFGKVWYEGYSEPSYTWQSTGMTDAFESKLSMIPLMFGTIKGTVYSMLFAIPIALLAAIYTSEFLHHRVRSTVKPMMEMMASLPSVVLGFVAALVLAPLVETWIAAVLLAFLVVPLTLLGVAYLWQFLPVRLANRIGSWPKLVLILVAVLVGVVGAYAAGPEFERLFFGGNFKLWVSGQGGGATPFLFLLFLPLSYVVVGLLESRMGGRQLRQVMRRAGVVGAGALDLLRWIGTTLVAAGLSYGLALLFDAFGLDPRGGFVGTYVQRNTLVIGFAMGFAVIPIIYTLAEDALNAVPEHLRSASLGCGATPWQTALWIILPTAMSGVFSAIMIGMGRAVGETMIVVMAAGNTPLLDWNVFNGLRALSANIAVELPEAVKGGTLYRTLFLSALLLFGMTFIINTVAEMVRLRFRKRSMQL